jgi:hypothetical protein
VPADARDILADAQIGQQYMHDIYLFARDLFGSWHPDAKTAIVTMVVIPVGFLALRALAKALKHWVSFLIDGLLYWAGRSVLHSLAAQLSLKQYCKLQLKSDSRFVYVPSRNDIKIPVDDIFITLQLEHHSGARESYTHKDLFKISNRIRIMGDPGSGKSSLSKRIFRDASLAGVHQPRKAQLPCLLELKTLRLPASTKETALAESLYKQLKDNAANFQIYKMSECFDVYAKGSGLLVLLDGLDEVSKQQYSRVLGAIQGLSNKLAGMSDNNVIVVTMRTQFYQQVRDDFRNSIGTAYFIRRFTPTDIYDFLSRWPFKETMQNMVTQVYADLTDRPTLREMCANPLVLSMYVADLQSSSGGFAPESRTEFYKRVTEELITKRRIQQTGKAVAVAKSREQREKILGRLAYEHLRNSSQSSNSLRWSEAIRIVKETLGCDPKTAEDVFREIEKETGLITEERPRETLRFIHLTFCEFLAASEAIEGQKDGWGGLIRTHKEFQAANNPQTHARLLEVIPFAAGLIPRVRRHDAISEVSELGDLRLLARCFLETKAYEHPSWKHFVETMQAKFISKRESDWTDESLRDLHLFNAVVRDQQQCATHVPNLYSVDLDTFYQELVSRHNEGLATLVSAYATQDAAAAFRLAENCNLDLPSAFPEIVIQNCDQAPFLELILQKACSDEASLKKWAPLLAEAGLRSRLVAAMLSKHPPDRKLKTMLNSFRGCSWHKGTIESLYTQMISFATDASRASVGQFAALSLLGCLSSRKAALLFSRSFRLAHVLFGVLCFLLSLLVANGLHYEKPHASLLDPSFWKSAGVQLCAAALGVVPFYYLTFWWLCHRFFYRATLNLPRTVVVPSGPFLSITQIMHGPNKSDDKSPKLPFAWMISRKERAILEGLEKLRNKRDA